MQAFKAKVRIEAGRVVASVVWTDSFAAGADFPITNWLLQQTSATFKCADTCRLLIAGVMQGGECVSHTILAGE